MFKTITPAVNKVPKRKPEKVLQVGEEEEEREIDRLGRYMEAVKQMSAATGWN